MAWPLVLGAAVAVAARGAGAARVAGAPSLEYRVKAAFLYHFVEFVTWPPQAFAQGDSPVVFCVLGEDPFGDVLEQTLRGKTVGGRKLVLTHGGAGRGCHVLFISRSEEKRLSQILSELEEQHTLTVSEIDGFVQRGGMINFTEEKNRIRFEINVEAAGRAGLVISSRLLSLAKTVLPLRASRGG